jgi:acyl carrier protein
MQLTVEVVIEAVREVLDYKPDRPDGELTLTGETPLEALNFSSLDVTELFAILEDRVVHSLDPGSVGEMKTISDVTRLRAESLDL